MKKLPFRMPLLVVALMTLFFTETRAQERLSGTTSVSATGGSVHTVQIQTPKGVGDMRPSISLTYNSQSGNGVAGFGCSITGISIITRGTKDYAHDNTANGLKYSTVDALYLDGRRLILVTGSSGTDGAVYSPEGEPQTTVTLHGASNTTSSWFEVNTNDGMTYQYGNGTACQQQVTINNTTMPHCWYINKATNALGQTMTYSYLTDNRCLFPQTISYGSGNTVTFTYEARTDSVHFSLRGNKGCMGKRLKTIVTKSSSSVYRTYTLAYNSTSDATAYKFSRLVSITETGENGSGSRQMNLAWTYMPACSPSSTAAGITAPADVPGAWTYSNRHFAAADVNGDGISDVLHVAKYTAGGHEYIDTKVFCSIMDSGIISYDDPLNAFRVAGEFHDDVWTYQSGGVMAGDIDGDGINDLIIPDFGNENISTQFSFCFKYVLGQGLANGSSGLNGTWGVNNVAATEMPLYTIADFDNDGKADMIVLERQQSSGKYTCHLTHIINGSNDYQRPLTLSAKPQRLFTADYNVDGLVDLLVFTDSGYKIFYNQGGTLSASTFLDNATKVTTLCNHNQMGLGDFNGDGIADIIWNARNQNKVYIETGNGNGTFTKHEAYTLPFTSRQKNKDDNTWDFVVTDLDHDGRADVVINAANYNANVFGDYVIFDKTYTLWLLSNGTTLTLKKQATSTRKDDAKAGHVFAGDFKGQGWGDVMNYGYDCYNGSNANVDPTMHLYRTASQTISDGKLSSVRNSDGLYTWFYYGSMASDLLYTKGTGSTYPVIDVAAPLCLVSKVRESGGPSVIRQNNYTYKALRTHLRGRGLLGFTEQSTTETYTGRQVNTRITSANLNLMVPLRTLTTTTQGGYTSTTSAFNNVVMTGSNFRAYPSSLTNTDIYGNRDSTIYFYDTTRGYLQRQTTQYGGSNMYRQTEYTYYTDKIGGAYRPKTVKLTQKHSDSNQAYTDQTEYTYTSAGLTSSVVEHKGKPQAQTTAYLYDTYGNCTQETVSASGISTPMVTNYQYLSGRYLSKKTTTPASTTIQYGRNSFGELTAVVDQTINVSSPLVTTYVRDGFGMVTKETKPTGEVTNYSRVANTNWGYQKTETGNDGHSYTWNYDPWDNELSTSTYGIAGVLVTTSSNYDVKGLLTSKTTTKGSLTVTESMTYDALGRVTARSSTNGESIGYSYGNRTVTTTKAGNSYTKTFDAWGNVVESTDPKTSVAFSYHSNGKPAEVTSEGSTVYMEYDAVGNQAELEDPDAGIISYEYDALGRVTRQTDARGNDILYSYDALGRVSQRNCEGTVTTYTYGTSGNGNQQLVQQQTGDRTIAYGYDTKGRMVSETRSMTGETSVTFSYSYDSYGRLASKGYPGNVTVTYKYDHCGHLVGSQIGSRCVSLLSTDNGLTATIGYGGTIADDGQIVSVNSPVMTHTSTHNAQGYLSGLTLKKGTATLRSMTFSFLGMTGNLTYRTGMTSYQEDFNYDSLDRLTRVMNGNTTVQAVSYADNGNLTSKTGVGTLHYDGTQPHAVTSADNTSGYIPSTTQQVTYNAFGKVSSITDGSYNMTFTYGPDEERWKTVLKQNGTARRTTFYAGDYERVTEDGHTYHFYYLDDGCIYVVTDSQTSGTYYYAFTDHLGSITRIFNEAGTSVYEAEYDAWGKQTVTKNTIHFRRGYTGHEMMPEFGLVNMNGRLYDPILGRFLSPDNFVQMPDFSQSFNRYAYCINNPLKYNDPDGEWFGIDDLLVAAAGFTFGYFSNAISSGSWGWASVEAGLSSAVSSWLGYNTAGLLGGKSSGVWSQIGQMGINTTVNSLCPNAFFPISANIGVSFSPAVGFGDGVLSVGLNMSILYNNGDFFLSNTFGMTNNFCGIYHEIGIKDFHLGYGRTYYNAYKIGNSEVGSQTVGSFRIGIDNVSFTLSNDLFGESHQDRWRTSAAELAIGKYTVGTYIITNDGQNESNHKTEEIPSRLWGLNKSKKAHEKGLVYVAPFWIGYKTNHQITRIGYSVPFVQDLTQNGVHHYFKPGAAPDYVIYNSFRRGVFSYYGFYNPISLWNR